MKRSGKEIPMCNFKKILSGALILVMAVAAEVQAGPIGNPTNQTPPQKLTVGPLIDVYSQDFKSNGYKISASGERLFFNFNYGVDRNIGFFGNAGFSKEDLRAGGLTFSGNYGMGVELGAKATFAELRRDRVKFGGGVKLLLARSSIDFSPGQRGNAVWSEFGLFGGASFESQSDLTPYFGLQLTRTTTKVDDFSLGGESNFDEDGIMGIFTGLDLKLQKDLSLGMELRLFNEISATINLGFAL
jgi:hypothetical protein